MTRAQIKAVVLRRITEQPCTAASLPSSQRGALRELELEGQIVCGHDYVWRTTEAHALSESGKSGPPLFTELDPERGVFECVCRAPGKDDHEGETCSACQGTGFAQRRMWYVNLYSVTRHFGGPEEGGWWYNQSEPVSSVVVTNFVDCLHEKTRLTKVGDDEIAEGDIYSVLGGTAYDVVIEPGPARRQPEERPRYE